MASETVDPIDWLHPPPSWAVPPEFHVLHGVNVGYKSQDLLQQPRGEHASWGMPGQRTACAATQGINVIAQNLYMVLDATVSNVNTERVAKCAEEGTVR